MRNDGEAETAIDWTSIEEQLLPDVQTALYDCLSRVGKPDRKRLRTLATSFTRTTVNEARTKLTGELQPHFTSALMASLLTDAIQRIEVADKTLEEIVSSADWEDVTRRVLGYTVQEFGSDHRDKVGEAVSLLLERRRHLRHYDGVGLVAFLCCTVKSLVLHSRRKIAKEGEPLSIVAMKPGRRLASNEYSEDLLIALEDNNDELEVAAIEKAERFFCTLDPQLAGYARLLAESTLESDEEYAAALNVSIVDVRKMRKQLKKLRDTWPVDGKQ